MNRSDPKTMTQGMAVGIDIESYQNLPATADACSDSFYLENFSAAEIAYCVGQPDPRLAFCGLWCAKEAAIKCAGGLGKLAPGEIEIVHEPTGRIELRLLGESTRAAVGDCHVSISHSAEFTVAICVKRPSTMFLSP